MKNIFIISVFIILTCILTYPLLWNINKYIPGFFSTDEPFGALWDSWRIKYSFAHHLSLASTGLVSYPFGVDLYKFGFFSYLWMWIIYLLSVISNPIITYNSQAVMNFFLSACFSYLLVYYLSGSRMAGLLSGIIFAFCPYQFVRTWQHLGLTYNQWIPLVLFSLFWLRDNDSRKSRILFFLSILLAFSFDWSVMYFTAVVLGCFFIYFIFCNRGKITAVINLLKRVSYIAIFVFMLLFAQFFPLIAKMAASHHKSAASAHNFYHRSFEDLFIQSAKPLSYFLPAVVNPIFGKFTEQFIGSDLYGDSLTEHALYLGWIPLTLAFIAFKKWKKNRKEVKLGTVPYGDSPYKREDFYIGFFIFLAMVAWLFSQPPWWKLGPLKIYMPSFFMYKILPMYRAYCRFGIVVMLAVAVLAGFGLKFLLEKFKSQKSKIAVTVFFCGLVLFEFWNWPPYKMIDVSGVPAVYYWLKEQPGDFVTAEYPLDADSPNEMYKFCQTKHEKKIINGTIPGTYANKVAQTITKLSEPKIAGVLKWMEVKYALVHREGYLQTELIEDRDELEKIPQNPGLKFIKSFPAQECPQKNIMCVQKTGPIDVYEVVAQPIEPEPKEK